MARTGNSPQPVSHQHFTFTRSQTDDTGQLMIAVTDSRTGFTVRTALNDAQRPVPSIMAFAGARYSRSALSAEKLFTEINHAKKSAQEKLANIFVNYGHASVGDMANLFAYIENVPRLLMMQFFYSSALGGGQERSSRYQDFGSATPPNMALYLPDNLTAKERQRITKEYHRLFTRLIQHYQDLKPQVETALTKLYQPDKDSKRHASALQARAFDTVRAFLPAGTPTSGAYITNAREWARMIQVFRSSSLHEAQCLGEQLQIMFAPPAEVAEQLGYVPEAPDLICHTEPLTHLSDLQLELREYTATLENLLYDTRKQASVHHQRVRLISPPLTPANTFLYCTLNSMYPHLSVEMFGSWYATLSGYTKKQLSRLLFSRFTHHHHLPLWAHSGGYSFELKMTLSEAIDFNRHRAWGRFATLLETADTTRLIRDGFQLPLYLEHPKLAKLKHEFVQCLETHYQELLAFAATLPPDVSPRLVASLLPNAHQIRYIMSGGPKEISYLTQLRVRPGGHINYRLAAYNLARVAGRIDPLLDALRLPASDKPDAFSREQFFDRG